MSDDTVMLAGRVPKELKRLVDADSRNNQEVLEAALWREFGGKRQSAIEAQIESKRTQLSGIQAEKDNLTDEEQRLQTEITALQERAESMQSSEQALADDLDDLLDDLEANGTHIWEDAEPIHDIAKQHGADPSDVFHRLRTRAGEQGRDMTDHQFHKANRTPQTRPKPVSEVYGDGDE